jgi:hypothetical protein
MKDILFSCSTFESKLILEDNQSHLNDDVIFFAQTSRNDLHGLSHPFDGQ